MIRKLCVTLSPGTPQVKRDRAGIEERYGPNPAIKPERTAPYMQCFEAIFSREMH
ncbi:MAG: hypothetical protein HQ555_11675 [Candidatus Aminicenantes bacterium]|nr:hypothetical protein [Candidatus Aminicenantes bacterium]